MVGLGTAALWSSPALPYLKSNESEIDLSSKEASWVASIFSIGAIAGYLIYPFFMDRIGRKYTLLLLAIPQIASWVTIILAKNASALYVARFISGLGYCAGFATQSIYISEITEKSVRGLVLVCSKLNLEIGSLLVVTVGAFCSYKSMNLIMLLTPLLFFVTFIFMPETPYFHLINGNHEKAIKSVSKLRRTKNLGIIEPEINRIKKAIVEGESNKNGLQLIFSQRRCRKALVITTVAWLTTGFSGSAAIDSFTQDILIESGFSFDPEYATILVVGVKIIGGLIGSQLIENVGRRVLYLCAGILGFFSLGIVGLFFFLKIYLQIENLSLVSWVPLFGLIIFEMVSAGSLSTTPIVLTVELFPTEVKSVASAITFVIFEIIAFFITLSFSGFNEIVGIYTTFWIYGTCCIVGTSIVYCIAPETKGKSLEEIQEILDFDDQLEK